MSPPAGGPRLDVEPIQIRRYREMRPEQRLAAALELNAALDELALAGIHRRHGPLSSREARLRLFALRLDRDEMVRAFGWDPGPPGG